MTFDAITSKVMAVIDSNKSERDLKQKPLTLFAIPLQITMTFDAITSKVMAVIDSNKSERDLSKNRSHFLPSRSGPLVSGPDGGAAASKRGSNHTGTM